MCVKQCDLLLCLLVVAGCSESTKTAPAYVNRIPTAIDIALDQAEEFELFSINSEQDYSNLDEQPTLGKTKIENPADRKRLIQAFRKGVEEVKHGQALCFAPRHGIRLKQGDVTLDLLICFECFSVYPLKNRQPMPREKGRDSGFAIERSPEQVFDEILTKAGVELAPKAGEQ